jgi:hypothetical protein
MKTGTADLPRHGGRVPTWLASRMARLDRAIAEAPVIEYGRDEPVRCTGTAAWSPTTAIGRWCSRG